jgi:Ca2+/Na+ antiporter
MTGLGVRSDKTLMIKVGFHKGDTVIRCMVFNFIISLGLLALIMDDHVTINICINQYQYFLLVGTCFFMTLISAWPL